MYKSNKIIDYRQTANVIFLWEPKKVYLGLARKRYRIIKRRVFGKLHYGRKSTT